MNDFCKVCQLPLDLCICIEKKQGKIKINCSTRKYNKPVTTVEGLSNPNAYLKELKKLCAGGGTIKGGVIEIQGNHLDKVKAYFKNLKLL